MPAAGTALIVAGPTASGKSALALALARRMDGVVINADAMQLYRELRILTARPTPADEALAPHVLYGVRPAAALATAAWWRAAALAEMQAARAAGLLPILCGGSGLYLLALTQGLADIPDPGRAARAEARALLVELGSAGLHARLAAVDPATAARLRPSDRQRIARAYEVWRGTGTGLAAWQGRGQPQAPDWRFAAVLLAPRGRSCAPPPQSASRRCWNKARLRRCGTCWRRTSIRLCRRCARMVCRNSPRICAGRSPWPRRRRAPSPPPGAT